MKQIQIIFMSTPADAQAFGESERSHSERGMVLIRVFVSASIKNPERPSLKANFWRYLYFNPVSVPICQTLKTLGRDAGIATIIYAIMAGCRSIPESLDINVVDPPDEHIEIVAEIGACKHPFNGTSRLAGRTGLDVLLCSVVEITALTNLLAPVCKTIYHLTCVGIAARS